MLSAEARNHESQLGGSGVKCVFMFPVFFYLLSFTQRGTNLELLYFEGFDLLLSITPVYGKKNIFADNQDQI